MKSDEKSPEGFCRSKRGVIIYGGRDEDMKKIFVNLTTRQQKVVNLLLSRKCSAADISIELGYSDPRSYFKRLIDKGIDVQSVWVDKPDNRYKVYWIEEPKKTPCNTEGVKTVGEIIQSDFKNLFERNHYD